MATSTTPTTKETDDKGALSTYVVNITETVIYPIQVSAKSPVYAGAIAEEVYNGGEFNPEKESAKVDTGHDIYSEHVETEIVACNGKSLSQSAQLELKIKLFCAGKGIEPDDRPKFSTARARVALDAFARLQGKGSEAELVTDLLADLMHLCDQRGIDFNEVLDTARGNYEGEK